VGKEVSSKAQESKPKRPARPPVSTQTPTTDGLGAVQRAQANPLSASPQDIAQLQGRYGNRAIRRLIQRAQAPLPYEGQVGLEGGEVEGGLQGQINAARGGGHPLDKGASSQIGGALGADLSGVRVHTDSQADTLNRSLSAKAFTLGSDVFFSKGAYNPGTSSGAHLLAHELTHVVQQGGAIQSNGATQSSGAARNGTKPNKIQTMKQGSGAGFLRRSLGGFIQRDIDRAGFEEALRKERSFGNALETLLQNTSYTNLISKIKKYNHKNNLRRLKKVKEALTPVEDALKKDFYNAYEYLVEEINREERLNSKPPKTTPVLKSKHSQDKDEIPPLREEPKRGDMQFRPSFREEDNYVPPLREEPKRHDRQLRPSFGEQDDFTPSFRQEPKSRHQPSVINFGRFDEEPPPLREGPKPGDRVITFEDFEDDEAFEEKKLNVNSSPKLPAWRQPLSFGTDQDDDFREEKESPLSFLSHSNDFNKDKKEKKHSSRHTSRSNRSNKDDLESGKKEKKHSSKESSRRKSPSIRSNDDSDSEETPRSPTLKESSPSFRHRHRKDSLSEIFSPKQSSKGVSKQEQSLSFLSHLDDSSSEEETGVPYEQAVARRFISDNTGRIFLKLWETANLQQKEKLKSMFSDKKKHANLSGLEYVLEGLDPLHRLEHRGGLDHAAREWAKSTSNLYFFDWLAQQDNPSYHAKMGTVDYFDEEQRQNYALKLGSQIKYAKTNKAASGENIYVVSQANTFYARNAEGGGTDKGIVHHSSFMAGQSVKAAGHLVFKSPGKLATINLNSGHYKPKPEHMKNALRVLKRAQVDLSEVIAQPDMASDKKFIAQEWLEHHGKFL